MSNLKKYTHKKSKKESNKTENIEKIKPPKQQKNQNRENDFQANISLKKYSKYLPWIIIFVTIIVYYNSINNDFLNWDDDRYVTGNQYLALTWENIKYFFSNFYFVMYIPLTMLSYMLDYQIAGLELPWVYHLHNLILHLATTVLIYFFIKKLFDENNRKYTIAFLTALLFGIHPLHVESVSWIAERKDVLYAMYFMASLFTYLFYVKTNKLKFLALTFILFLFSLLAKTQAVVLPFALILIDYLKRNFIDNKDNLLNFIILKDKRQIKIFIEKLPFFLLSATFAYIAIRASGTSEPFAENITTDTKIAVETGYGLIESLALVSYSLFLYVAELLVPFKQSAIHPYPFDAGQMPGYFYIFIIFPLAYFATMLWAWIKNKKVIFFSLTFFLANIFIVLRIKNFIISEHYEYIPSIGLFLLFAFILNDFILKHRNLEKIIYSITFIYILLLSVQTIRRNFVFKDSLSFWNDVTSKHSNVIVGYYNRGNYLQKLGDEIAENDKTKAIEFFNQAIADYDKTIELNPTNVGAYSNRGITKAKLGKYYEAIADFNKVVEIDSTYGNVYSNRGNAFALTGQWQKALNDYNKAIELKPNFADALFNRGMAFANLNRNKEAINDFTKVLELSPDRNDIYKQRGMSYYFDNKFTEAIQDLTTYLKLYPNDYTALYYRALSFEKNNQKEKAKKDFKELKKYPQIIKSILKTITNLEILGDKTGEKSYYLQAIDLTKDILKIDENNSEAYSRMGVLYGKIGDIRKAFELLNKAIKLDSNNYQAYADRGYAYFISGNNRKALSDYNRAIEINPNNFVAFYNRALLYEKLNKYELAINDYSSALAVKNDYALAYFRRGLLFQKNGNKTAACQDWTKAKQLKLNDADFYLSKYCNQ